VRPARHRIVIRGDRLCGGFLTHLSIIPKRFNGQPINAPYRSDA
jgi:hypothetical protein